MNNFFEQELQKLFGDGMIIGDPAFSGRSCYGTLGKDLRVRAQFITTRVSDEYDALKLTVLNRTEGQVDAMILRLKDLLGKKPVPGNPNFPNGVSPYIWNDYGKLEWYAFHPTPADYETIRQAAEQYLDVFRDRQQEQERIQDGPKLVYICAPLWGDVEKNIEFARQKAQEVFQTGDIPVCPHLMFSLLADPEKPEQYQAVQEMGLRLVESCQQVNVYGTVLSERMWAEVNHAILRDIPVKSDLKALGHTQPHRQAARKGKGER